jgi:acetyl-CoA acetyltransferase
MPRPRDVAIVGVYSTEQEHLSQRSTVSISLEAIHGALADAGLALSDVDAYFGLTFPLGNGMGPSDGNVARQLGHALHIVNPMSGAMALLQAAAAIRDGLCEVAILASGSSRAASEGGVVDWTRPDYEFTEWTGSITPAQMALQMRRHMYEFGTTAEQLAHACATVRNHGHINPDAVMFERAGVRHDDVDLVMVYDHFASGIVMQYEALGFCEVGAGGPFVMENIGLDDPFPICPDGGNLAFSHPGNPYNFKIIEAVKQFRGDVRDLCPNGDRGLHTYDRSVCRKLRDPKIAVACGPMTGRHSFAVLARD